MILGGDASVWIIDSKIASWIWKNFGFEDRYLTARNASTEIAGALDEMRDLHLEWTAHVAELFGNHAEANGIDPRPRRAGSGALGPWLTTSEAAALVQKSSRQVTGLACLEVIDAHRNGRRWVINTDSLLEHFDITYEEAERRMAAADNDRIEAAVKGALDRAGITVSEELVDQMVSDIGTPPRPLGEAGRTEATRRFGTRQ